MHRPMDRTLMVLTITRITIRRTMALPIPEARTPMAEALTAAIFQAATTDALTPTPWANYVDQ